ncbi:unnamed protein product [Orchesella dallaii]|uniref:Uncharacterized protein n=1 Tax=Orchesella dallaii TaxID=48710 RepID=A0ABP1PHB9_9HEXA
MDAGLISNPSTPGHRTPLICRDTWTPDSGHLRNHGTPGHRTPDPSKIMGHLDTGLRTPLRSWDTGLRTPLKFWDTWTPDFGHLKNPGTPGLRTPWDTGVHVGCQVESPNHDVALAGESSDTSAPDDTLPVRDTIAHAGGQREILTASPAKTDVGIRKLVSARPSVIEGFSYSRSEREITSPSPNRVVINGRQGRGAQATILDFSLTESEIQPPEESGTPWGITPIIPVFGMMKAFLAFHSTSRQATLNLKPKLLTIRLKMRNPGSKAIRRENVQ